MVIIDFGNGLKSILTSLAYTDVSEKDILIVAANQWFDDSILSETSIKSFYFPSINLKNFKRFNKNFFKNYEYKPSEITILSYDAIGLIYYLWKNNIKINTASDFNFKKKLKQKLANLKYLIIKFYKNLKYIN